MCNFSTKEDAERYAEDIEQNSNTKTVISNRFTDDMGFTGYAVYYRNPTGTRGISFS